MAMPNVNWPLSVARKVSDIQTTSQQHLEARLLGTSKNNLNGVVYFIIIL